MERQQGHDKQCQIRAGLSLGFDSTRFGLCAGSGSGSTPTQPPLDLLGLLISIFGAPAPWKVREQWQQSNIIRLKCSGGWGQWDSGTVKGRGTVGTGRGR